MQLSNCGELLESPSNYAKELRLISRDLDVSRGRFLSNLLNSTYLTGGEQTEIIAFLKKTWLWRVVSDLPFIEEIERVFPLFVTQEINELVSMGFLKAVDKQRWELTALGSLVNRTLLSPPSAKRIEDALIALLTKKTSRTSQNIIDLCLYNIVGLAFEMRLNPLDHVSEKSQSRTEMSHAIALRALSIPFDKWSLRIGSALEMWANGRAVEDIIRALSLTAADYGLLEELIPKNGAWVLQSMKLILMALRNGSELAASVERLMTSVSSGTNNEIAKSLISWDIPGLGRSSALHIVDRFGPKDVKALSKVNEGEFLKEFSAKPELSKRVFLEILNHAQLSIS